MKVDCLFHNGTMKKAINLTTLSIENKFPLLSFNNEIDFKFTFGKSDMYEPFANKSR